MAAPEARFASVGYFVNWGIYGRKFTPAHIPVKNVTHILYSFANVRPTTGEVYLSDLWADQDVHYPGDPTGNPTPGPNLYGNLKALYMLKKQNRTLKVLLSIGGWSYSPNFHPVVVNPSLRARFVSSAIRLLEDYGLDGFDIDYEFPETDAQAKGFAELLKEMRSALDKHASGKTPRPRFLLTIAAPCGPENYTKLRVAEMDKSLDLWNLMAYSFSGQWNTNTAHQANLRGAPGTLSIANAIQWYTTTAKVQRKKLILGVPLYGFAFANTNGPALGSPFTGVGRPGTWEAGIYDYRALPLPGLTVYEEGVQRGSGGAGASWSYDARKRELITFDDEAVGRLKGRYIKDERLGGSMFWELSGDKGGAARVGVEGGLGKDPQPGASLVKVVKDEMSVGGGGLETSLNCLSYAGSKFVNLRAGMP